VRFWDASAIVPLLLGQPATRVVQPLIEEVPEAVIWWGTPLECASAVARLRREGGLGPRAEADAHELLQEWREQCAEIQPTDRIRALASRLLRTHPLRAADSLQLAAALEWAGSPDGHVLVTLDRRLAHAALAEGFRVVPELDDHPRVPSPD
jgi:predicted nucleic acid-binding protein